MPRFFNTTGPCNPEKHYILPPESRLVRGQIERYIGDELYWVLHAPRQSGKTTFLQSWMRKINTQGQAVACYVSVERCQQFPDAAEAIPAICEAIREYAESYLGASLAPPMPRVEPASALSAILKNWSSLVAPKPLVVLFDEVDVLQDQALVSFLRQLRGGFAMRRIGSFPVSVALVGMRDLRDYQDSATLSSFTAADVRALAAQHTNETTQVFSADALSRVWELTRGQPWLVNAILQKCVWQLCPQGGAIDTPHIEEARELLIQERAVHLDSLAERLRDPRIKRIVELILTGNTDPELLRGDDFRFSIDMGLVSIESGSPAIANPIYREVVARVLSEPYQLSMPTPEFRWLNPDGGLDMAALLREFQNFWAQHADIWEEKADYGEAFPHLLLMAFLQRVVNGGGRIEREYAAGRGRVDLAVQYAGRWSIIEIKLVSRQGLERTVRQGIEQIIQYRDTVARQADAWLVVFDRTPAGRLKTWTERLTWYSVDTPSGTVTVVGA